MTRSVAAVVDQAAARLREAGFAPAESRAETGLLARSILGWTEATWLVRQQDAASPAFADALASLVARRAGHEPVAYLVGAREFYGRVFTVTRDVLIPRPETEGVVATALGVLESRTHPTPARALDIGTGSGCIAVSLACESADVELTATDISGPALAVASANARRHAVADRIVFREGAMLAGATGPWDVVVSNPPYVAWTDRSTLAADVRDFEPATALFGGEDGLAVIGPLVTAVVPVLAPGGALVLEIGAGQADRVCDLIRATGAFGPVTLAADLQGIPRVVLARRAA